MHGTQRYYFSSDNQSGATELVEEQPIAISINELNYAVIMITPVDVEAFIIGFCFAEGLITGMTELLDLSIHEETDTATLLPSHLRANIQLTGRAQHRASQIMRQRKGNSGCGLCGIEAIEQSFPNMPSLPNSPSLSDSQWLAAKSQFSQHQKVGHISGAIHGAMLLTHEGEFLAFAEDIGRHNALDKLIGKALKENLTLQKAHVLMSSRCSTELIQKGVRAKIASLGHLSSPSTLAVAQARDFNLHLVHIPRHSAPRHYH